MFLRLVTRVLLLRLYLMFVVFQIETRALFLRVYFTFVFLRL